MENDWQFSSHLYRTSSKSIQDYSLLFLPRTCAKTRSTAPSSGLSSFWSYINNCDRHLSWEMCSKPLKKTFKPKKAVLNLCGVMIYNIVDGLSKLLCDPLPYLKTKKNDLITTYAKRGTTTVHYRCTTMSFIYFLNVWVINLDNKGYWMTEREWKIVHRPTHYFRWGQRGFKTFRPSVREKVFCRIITL